MLAEKYHVGPITPIMSQGSLASVRLADLLLLCQRPPASPRTWNLCLGDEGSSGSKRSLRNR